MIFAQIFDMVNIGIVVLDRDLRVRYWNRWMVLHSGLNADEIIGGSIFEIYPNLNTPRFLRSCKAVLTFGNFAFFSQKLHRYLFPFKPSSTFGVEMECMQQSCTMGPLRDEDNSIEYLYITVQDVTDVVAYEQKLLEMNMQDSLTETYNRRFLEVYMQKEFERHKRYSSSFSIIMIDIDHFKNVNDIYGHQCGDFVLKGIASEIRESIRKMDFLGRYGGEEFCCLLPDTALRRSMFVAERIRKNIAERIFTYQDAVVQVTVSLGVAELTADIQSAEDLLRIADDSLYEAKRNSRNRVVALQAPDFRFVP